MKPGVWCQWDVSENIGDKKKICGKAVSKNRRWCDEHEARLPFWPKGK